MKKEVQMPHLIQSISELHSLLKIPKPEHPLVSFVDLSKITCHFEDNLKSVVYSFYTCLLYTSPSPRDRQKSRMPSSA